MTVINTNTAANLTANALTENQRSMNQTMERLSTGSRINSASDDAAGLAIVSKMDAQVTGLNQAVRNANDAIAMIQTADGATIEIDAMLQRMRELAVQSLNGTNTDTDLTNLNLEFANLATEIDRVVDTTEYNDTVILNGDNGTAGVYTFNIGANASQTVSVDFKDFNLAAGSTAGTAGVQTLNISLADVNNVTALSSLVFTEADGSTFVVDDAAIVAAQLLTAGAGGAGTDLQDTDYATLIQAINTQIGAATAFGALTFAAGTANTTITATQGAAGTGGLLSVQTRTGVGVEAAIGSIDDTTVGAAAGNGDPMSANLSTYATAGSLAQASTTIANLDAAIAGVAAQRAEFGSWVNRLEHTVDNLTNISQNTVASRSRIEDADYAAETTELARTQIISQAATAMLSQANQQAQSVLALLK
ncbi:flagellin [Porticoccaceae bacterium]|nr:flagellin [Porticoccaceae bacterium]